MTIHKPLDSIEKADLEALVNNNIPESKTLEYKEQLNLKGDGEKKAFLAEVSGFANAAGGDLIIGIKEQEDDNGDKSTEAVPLKTSETGTVDEYKLKLEQLIQSGIEPKLRLDIKPVIWEEYEYDKAYLLVIRVPQSFNAPHMITLKDSSKFFTRNSGGKHQLNVHEIRNAILANDAHGEKVRNFIRDRLGKIIADEVPAQLFTTEKFVLHIIPLNSFLTNKKLQTRLEDLKTPNLYPLYLPAANHRFNLDGFLTYSAESPESGGIGYLQLFFEGGMLETVNSTLFQTHENGVTNEKSTYIISPDGDKTFFYEVQRYFEILDQFGAGLPAFVFISLLNCKGAEIQRANSYYPSPFATNHLDRNEVILPEVLIEDWDTPLPEQMKPIFDSLWNAFGFERSPNYDENRRWKFNG